MAPPGIPLQDRFWSKVEKTDGCWLWTAGTSPFGHGRINVEGRPREAHRLSWEWAYGSIPPGQVVRHRCDNPRCVRPDHLELGTRAENLADARARGRWHNDPARKRDAVPGQGRSRPLSERFWEKVAVGDPEACWLWTGARTVKGYGAIWVNERGRKVIASRVAYELARGSIPEGLSILHSCDTPLCCNPAHLRAGTLGDNAADRGARRRGREHQQSGEANLNAKLTAADVNAIRLAVGLGETQTVVAARFGIHQQQVSRIVRRIQWAEVAPGQL